MKIYKVLAAKSESGNSKCAQLQNVVPALTHGHQAELLPQ